MLINYMFIIAICLQFKCFRYINFFLALSRDQTFVFGLPKS